MKIFHCDNLTSRVLRCEVAPWEFVQTESITAQIRHDKSERQNWYHNPATKHHFYSLVEPWNPNQRCSKKDNPPRLLHGFAVDYDMVMDDAYVDRALSQWKIKPAWTEASLGGKRRMLWTLDEPFVVGDYDFASFILDRSAEWLQMHLLPGIDLPALTAPDRMLCNGCAGWRKLGGSIPPAQAQHFFMQCGRAYQYKPADVVNIPIGEIEKELKQKYSRFAGWEGGFNYEAQGLSFWIDGSESPKSAIVKAEGMFTFSAHAAKPFYSWKELLGADFVNRYTAECMNTATRDIYYDGQKYWRLNPGKRCLEAEDLNAVQRHMKVNAGISTKADKDGTSQMERALQYISDYKRVDSAAPILFRPPGVLTICNKTVLNTLTESRVLKPSGGTTTWGPGGEFPFISMVLDNLFEPASQLRHYLSWLSHFYRSALAGEGRAGQAVYLIGGPGMGKTANNTLIVGGLVGGFADGSKFITGQDQFGAELFENPLIIVDDETVSSNDNQKVKMEAIVKQLVANAFQRTRQLYIKAGMTEWYGRLMFGGNLDLVSTRIIPALAEGMRDKVNFYRVADKENRPNLKFPSQPEIVQFVEKELPFFAQYLLDYIIPSEFIGDSRFHVIAYHDPILRERSAQSTRAAQFAELLYEQLAAYFRDHPTAEEYRATSTSLSRDIISNPLNQEILRTLRAEQVTRYLEQLVRDGTFPCQVETVSHAIRVWRFGRVELDKNLPTASNGTSFRKQTS